MKSIMKPLQGAISSVDRRIAREAQIHLFNRVAGALDRVATLMETVRDLHENKKITTVERRTRIAEIELEYRIIKETILDRTLPSVSRVELADLVAMLPRGDDDVPAEVAPGETGPERAKRESVELLRQVLAAGGVKRPGLRLVRPEQEGDTRVG